MYETVRNALETFSIQIGLTDSAAQRLLEQSLSNNKWKTQLKIELLELVKDPHAPWFDLVSNRDYEIDCPDDEEEAREIVLKLLWRAVFGNRDPRKPRPGWTEGDPNQQLWTDK